MTLEEIYAAESDWAKRKELIEAEAPEVDPYIQEYVEMKRDIRDEQVGNRKDKIAQSGETIPVNKIPIPFQQHIVKTASAMLFGRPVKLDSDQDIDALIAEWTDYRIDSLLLKACEEAKAFTQSALLFRMVQPEGEDKRLDVIILSPKTGILIPLWGSFDTLDAFAYQTEVKRDGEDATLTYIFDATTVTVLLTNNDGTTVDTSAPHEFDRIPIVYFEEEQVEYEDVKGLIDRYENRFSKFADTNDYFSSPFFKAVGKVDNAPGKDDTGSIFMMDVIETDSGQIITSDLDVVSWDAAPQATQMELDLTKELIFNLSMTPDLSFDNVKGLGAVSGIALKLMFLQAQMKARYSEGNYRVAVQRVISLFIRGLSMVDSEVSEALLETPINVKFQSIMPENVQETVGMLMEATFNQAIMSQETATKLNPLVDDATTELEIMKRESESQQSLGETFGI